MIFSLLTLTRLGQLHCLMKKKVVILTQSTNQFVLVVLLLFGLVWSTVQATELRLDGDLVLGALFPIHKPGCSEIQREDGIQPLEALLFTLDRINADPNLLPGIRLGVRAIDSCDDPFHAATRSLSLLRGFISREANLSCAAVFDESATTTNGVKQSMPLTAGWRCQDNLVGIVGPQTSAVSIQLATLGRLFKVPQVSYLATSVALCEDEEFPYFFRTVPSDIHQAKAIVELLKVFDLTYASIVLSNSEYGMTGYAALLKHVSMTDKVCLADPITIYNEHFDEKDYIQVIKQLLENKLSRVVIVFADRVPAGRLLEAAQNMNMNGHFVWIGSDAWASRESVVENREEIVEGAIAVQPLRQELPGFNSYFSKLIQTGNPRNPWFEEYLNRHHGCSSDPGKTGLRPLCNATTDHNYSQQLYVHFVRDAVYAFAHALHNMHQDTCGFGAKLLCPEFRQKVFTGLKSYLQNVTFPDVADKMFVFDGLGRHDGPPRYSIINFQRRPNSVKATAKRAHDWHNVGMFHYNKFSDWDLDFKNSFLKDKSAVRCSRIQCQVHEIEVQNTLDHCCWHCRPCSDLEYKASDFECGRCPLGTRSDGPNRTGCVLIQETSLDYSNPWAIGSMALAAIGMLAVATTTIIICCFWETPVVKASGRELSLLLLVGTFLSFMATFVIVAKPSPISCGIMRFLIGFCYTICYAAVVTKTNRVARIFQARGDSPRFTSPLSTLIIASCLILVEVIINGLWLISEPPETHHVHIITGERILVCNGVDGSFITGLIFPFILIFCATLYAFKTRKCPGGFNETRFIFFANTINTIHWVVYVPLYFASTDPEIRAVILALSLSLSGMVQLSCLLFPKVYTVLFKPEKNTRGKVMTHHRSRSVNIPETPPNLVVGDRMNKGPSGMQHRHIDLLLNQVSAAIHSTESTPQLLSTSSTSNAAKIVTSNDSCPGFNRQMTWSFVSSQAAIGADLERHRARSSSVCRGTQTSSATTPVLESKDRAINFTVSGPSEYEGSDDEDELEAQEGQER